MSSSSSAPNLTRDQHILAVGRQCSHPSCHLVDFLPFKCQHCADSFCADHFKPTSHNCAKYDEAKYNRVAPDCPLCNEPVSIPPGEDPNIRMERHLTMDCTVMTGRSQKSSATPKCARPKCGKPLFAPIQCDKCHQKFCPEHRFPNSHSCSSITSTTSLSPPSTASKPNPRVPITSSSAFAAIKRATAPVKPTALSPPTTASTVSPPAIGGAPPSGVAASGSKSDTSRLKPFSKTERRSKQERDSQIRAMRARAQKGLLSEDEKVILASLEAERAHGTRNKDCVVM